jgi:hypothetical protein
MCTARGAGSLQAITSQFHRGFESGAERLKNRAVRGEKIRGQEARRRARVRAHARGEVRLVDPTSLLGRYGRA